MTDNDIIKALECEIRRAEYVDTEYLDCVEVKDFKLALDLINRQKAEIERLKLEIDGVKEANCILRNNNEIAINKAITEFAERLKLRVEGIPWCECKPVQNAIDELAKEMKGEQ